MNASNLCLCRIFQRDSFVGESIKCFQVAPMITLEVKFSFDGLSKIKKKQATEIRRDL